MIKSFFAHIFVKNGSMYVKPRPQWSSACSIHNSSSTLHRRKCFVLWYLSVIMPPGRAPTCLSGFTFLLDSLFTRHVFFPILVLLRSLCFAFSLQS